MAVEYTPKQGQYLAFIYYYTKIHGVLPAEADMQRYFRVSPPPVHEMVKSLERHEFIVREPGRPRSIRLRIAKEELPDLESGAPIHDSSCGRKGCLGDRRRRTHEIEARWGREKVAHAIHTGMNDVFRPIDGFPGYRVSSSGEVQSCWVRRGRIATLTNCWRSLTPIERLGYKTVNLTRGAGNKTALRIHRLVLEAFVGPCPEGLICLHGDGNPTNNSLENLRFDSPKANSDDKIRHGTMIRGEAARHARLREAEVLEIRLLRASGHPATLLAEKFGVSVRNVQAIVQGRTWRHLLPHGEATTLDPESMRSRGDAA